MPGYFYVSANAPTGVKVEAVTDAALPVGTKYAITAELDTTLPDNFIFGWNWRQDTAEKKWNFADLSAYAAVSFWVKSETTGAAVVFSYYQYDDTNFLASSGTGGACAVEPCMPISEYKSVVARKTGWARVVQRFADFTSGTPNLKGIARIDFLQLRLSTGGPTAKLFITGVQLLKEAELPPL